MTRRDTYIVTVVAVVGAIAAFWMLALSPKRKELSALDKDIATAQQAVDQAKQDKTKFARDQVAFPQLYASLGRLGKAVPASQDVPSLLVQLNHAAAKANVNFHSVEMKMDLAEKIEQAAAESSASAAAAPPAEGGSATPPAGGEGAQATPPAGGEAAPAAGATGAAGSSATASAGATAGAPAAGGATTSDPGTPSPAAASFKALPFEYKFRGDFFDLEELIHNVTRLVERRNQELAITGRLITIQGFSMKNGKITVLATTYMLPADQGLFAGATPSGPADAAAPQAAAGGSPTPAPPTAAVTSP